MDNIGKILSIISDRKHVEVHFSYGLEFPDLGIDGWTQKLVKFSY